MNVIKIDFNVSPFTSITIDSMSRRRGLRLEGVAPLLFVTPTEEIWLQIALKWDRPVIQGTEISFLVTVVREEEVDRVEVAVGLAQIATHR